MEEMINFLSQAYSGSDGSKGRKEGGMKDGRVDDRVVDEGGENATHPPITPHTPYTTLDIFSLSPRKLASLLTSLDIYFILQINPKELVEYDGKNKMTHIKEKNAGLTNYFSSLMDSSTHDYFLRVMRHLKRLRNLNSLECLSKAFKTQRLKKRDLSRLSRLEEDISSYFTLRHNYDYPLLVIYPFDLFLKDVEDSNLNLNSEDASRRFCHLMEMLVTLQNSLHPEEKPLKEKYKRFFLGKIEEFLNYRAKTPHTTPQADGVFLII